MFKRTLLTLMVLSLSSASALAATNLANKPITLCPRLVFCPDTNSQHCMAGSGWKVYGTNFTLPSGGILRFGSANVIFTSNSATAICNYVMTDRPFQQELGFQRTGLQNVPRSTENGWSGPGAMTSCTSKSPSICPFIPQS
jgi:hypothetical protein